MADPRRDPQSGVRAPAPGAADAAPGRAQPEPGDADIQAAPAPARVSPAPPVPSSEAGRWLAALFLPPQHGSVEARRVGFALARHREQHRVALDELAEWSGVPVDRLIAFEGGRELPARGEIERLVNAFTRVDEPSRVDVRAMRAELLRLGGYPRRP
jgi:hypothetical protein